MGFGDDNYCKFFGWTLYCDLTEDYYFWGIFKDIFFIGIWIIIEFYWNIIEFESFSINSYILIYKNSIYCPNKKPEEKWIIHILIIKNKYKKKKNLE